MDLQVSLCSQIADLFPGYKQFGNNSEGIEYSINNRRFDVLLENREASDPLAVELKSWEADYKDFGQISMYIGLLQEGFPNKASATYFFAISKRGGVPLPPSTAEPKDPLLDIIGIAEGENTDVAREHDAYLYGAS